ncbi:terminase family protein [Candidatus Pacearchaeota archaeon]|jgi:PBSX family phage terminase large subunit|nr:terminase family protein [Candidatus Pacearchaeota archaeon]
MNVYALQQQFRKIKRKAARPAVIATLPSGPVEIEPGELLNYFIAAIRLGDIPRDHDLFPIFQQAGEDDQQGQIFECLRKLAQGIEPEKGTNDLMLPRGKQAESILASIDHPLSINLWYGSVRSSKTIMSLIVWLWRCANGRKGRRMMIGNTTETLELNCIEPLKDLLPSAINHVHGWRQFFIFGRTISIRGANDVGQEKKFRGPTLLDAYADEVTTWAKSVFKMLRTRMDKAGSTLLGTTNPDQPLHYIKTDYIDRVGEISIRLWHFILDDNPGLTDDYKADLVRENPPGTVYYLRFILGLWVAAEGRIYGFFTNDAKDETGKSMIVDELPAQFDLWRVAVDYGTVNPCVFGLYGKHERVWYKVKEYYWDSKKEGRQKTNAEYSRDMKAFLVWNEQPIRPRSIDVDPSAAGFIAQLRQDFPGIVVYSAINDVAPGIQKVSVALMLGWLKIFRQCVRTISEHMNYLWDEKAQQRGDEKPIKTNDHTCDETRYQAMRLFTGIAKVGAKPAGF